jgi:two-component system phosphate regulon sensor histidine kinase PhoR
MLLDEILFNLIDNAIKYNHPGGSVTVTTARMNGRVCLMVQDTGIGIPFEHRARVFERFYRVDKSHSKEVGGTGLGLSIVKHAAAYHHAAITLESAPDKGTTVTVQF